MAIPVTTPPPPEKFEVPKLESRVSVPITWSVLGSMNQTVWLSVDAAITVRESPPVAVAVSEVPRSMSVMSAGAPATPLPATPTLTTETTPCPAAFTWSCGRYIFCLPLTVTMPKAPVPPVCPLHVHVLGSQPLPQFPSHSSLFPLSTIPSPHVVSDVAKCLRFGFPLLCERVPLIRLQLFTAVAMSR